MSFLVSVDILPRFFWVFLGTGGKCRVHSSGSVVMCSAQMSAVGSVLSLLDSEMSSRPLVLGYMDLRGGGPNSFQWSRACVKAASAAPVSPIFSHILLKE